MEEGQEAKEHQGKKSQIKRWSWERARKEPKLEVGLAKKLCVSIGCRMVSPTIPTMEIRRGGVAFGELGHFVSGNLPMSKPQKLTECKVT